MLSEKAATPNKSFGHRNHGDVLVNSAELTLHLPKSQASSTMDDSAKCSNSIFFNSWMFQFQKMGLELKCPFCLNLFRGPMLLPCNHIICNSCIADCTRLGSECAVCKTQYTYRDLRPLPFVENLATIYRSLDATFSANLFQRLAPDDARTLEPCQASLTSTLNKKLTRESFRTSEGENICHGQSTFSLTASKCGEVPSGLNHSHKLGIDKSQNYNESGIATPDKAVEHDMSCKGGVDFGCGGKPNRKQCSQLEFGGHEEFGVVEMDMNQAAQSPLGSPPFDTKGSDSDQDRENLLHAERQICSSLKRASKDGNVGDRMTQLRSKSPASETEGLREIKRQKNLTHGPLDVGLKNPDHIKPNSKPVVSSCDVEVANSNTGICSFCQSSKISEVTGPMLHYADNGNLVVGDAVNQPNVIHVHRVCRDWAPQVYHIDDEAVQNLKIEVARGAKLKCSKCGLKGAALGCYVKSCRKTYHVLCAMEYTTCRWDFENYLMLCPAHCHVKFPHEKSRTKKQPCGKKPMPSQLVSLQSNPSVASADTDKKWVFCGSALSTEEKILLINFASKIGATVTKFWTPNVTHLIAATDKSGACSRTLKVLMAILNGRWILKMDWIKACMEVMHPVEEEPYEISLDNYGCLNGPKAGRLRALANEPKLLSGFSFYFSGDYTLADKEDLKDLVVAGGGTVLRSKEELAVECQDSEVVSSKMLVVYNLDPPEGCKLGDEVSILWQRLNEAEDLSSGTGSQVIGHTWLLDSIAACKLRPFVS